jgi:hypothetical protein
MAAESIHVVPSSDGWKVEEGGRQLSTHETQAEAEKFARDEAMRSHAELVIHGRDGQIERKDSFGHDPRPVKG